MLKRYWGAIITYILFYLSIYLFEPIFITLFNLTTEAANAYGRILGYFLAFIVILILMKPDIERGSSDAYPPKKTVLWCIYGVLIYFLVQAIYGLIAIVVFNMDPNSEHSEMIKNNVISFPFRIVNIAILGPIMEEILTKKIILDTLRKRTNVYIACLITSLVFALLHMELASVIPYTLAGLVYAFLYVKTNRLIVPIVVHMTINTLAILMKLI
ncbi:type II CAAX endopeptidase family protein [Bacillus mycoides]|uniref:CPBP family intramembrane metalloprotease n=1 Tax=Bacillus thuringiensis serovar navarrensis TaxID=339658 RepID=A0A243ANC1_BACTU|nr:MULTISPECIES: type II CAAX endopeptidase family protein [Bacillus cereus group]MED1265576.1 type II CAAX endopeptidase family protein [Bacillus mycoides]OTY27920.1 CPBP family intramembrane metalloprotease [Bacillus thuringiensis serovar navarrensis]